MAKSKKSSNGRLSKENYYLRIAEQLTERATCRGFHAGALIVKDDQIISTGYNGAPRGTQDCYERGSCLRRILKIPSGTRYELCRSVHAEQNAIINASRAGVSLLGGDLYLFGYKAHLGNREVIDTVPCFICKKMIINAGLNRIICGLKNGKYKTYTVDRWIKEWQKGDILDDKQQFGNGIKYEEEKLTKMNKKKFRK